MRLNSLCVAVALWGLLVVAIAAAEENPAEVPNSAKSQWVAISEPVTSAVKCDWPGLTAGVTADRSTGDVYMVVAGQGMWKSTDQGATFARADGGVIGGRCETGYSLCADTNGKRFFCFMLDGASGCTLDGGKTWEKLAQLGRGWDFAAVDWSVEKPQVIFTYQHESRGKYWLSSDGGKSWKQLGEDAESADGQTFGVGVVDAKTLVRWAGRSGIKRSVDAGVTWAKVSDEVPTGHVMVVSKGVCYWLGENGLLVSKNQGATWTVQGQAVKASWGPYFGKDENHVVVVGKGVVQETTDGGTTWKAVAALPSEFKGMDRPGWFLNFAFDPVHNIFYASTMGKATYKCQR